MLLSACQNDIVDFLNKGHGFHLSITTSGGTGTVIVTENRKVYPWGTVVALAPEPATNYFFGGWFGADGGEVYLDGSSWKIIMDSDKTLVATFSPESAVPAPTIIVSGTGVSRTVTISSGDPAATIYYTIDGTTPTTSSAVYSEAITVSGYYVSKTIVAIAVVSGTSSSLATETVYITPSPGSALELTDSNATVSEITLSGAAEDILEAYDLCYANDTIYVADGPNHRVLKVTTGGVVTVLAGTGIAGSDDGTGTSASFGGPHALATDGTNLYVTDTTYNNIRRIVLSSGVVTTLAGVASTTGTYVDGTGTSAGFSKPTGLWTDGTTLYVCDWDNYRIRAVNIATALVSTFAGTGYGVTTDGTGTDSAEFFGPYRITGDGTNLYVTEYHGNCVRKIVISTRAVTTFDTVFFHPAGITFDGTDLYLCNADAHQIQQLTLSGDITDVVSSGLWYPKGITTDGAVLYIADTSNGLLKKISP